LRRGEGVLEECHPVKVTQEEDVRTPGYGIGFVSECPISREADHAVELVIWDKQPSKMQQIYPEYSFIYFRQHYRNMIQAGGKRIKTAL
jgi:hypothetical protein